ncbi:uncharacterized protein K452DRAFT_39291 [Aplosporella prunicola CBS 121167]|uniref:DUF6697 domain-containing protein n=1 Tax=Aplosporella prunicola CBS 121167 TaxID=1176127 RepID=A0A6A6BB06_9PEZI|nr:uncharacterized protein K452DRAFT_39291 [Aplosporella prunicola CBS 121167]KAF2141422.1 hypothetical protein K452DRAFT_39291 [Aplosporella prunicola CBS 121167]
MSQHNGIPPHQSRPGGRSHMGNLNPTAGNFNPNSMPHSTTSTALVPRNEQPMEQSDDNAEIHMLRAQLANLENLFSNELIQMRREIDMLKKGGWTVTVGPFQAPDTVDNYGADAIHRRLEDSNSLQPLTSSSQQLQIEQSAPENACQPTPPQTPDHVNSSVRPLDPAQTCEQSTQTDEVPQKAGTASGSFVHASTSNGHDGTLGGEQDESIETRRAAAGLTSQTNGQTNGTVHKALAPNESVVATPGPEPEEESTPDKPLPTTEDPAHALMKKEPSWQPLGIRGLRALPASELSKVPGPSAMVGFDHTFIKRFFGGRQWSPGFHYVKAKEGHCILPSRSFYILDAATEPYLPSKPGTHGVKLTAFFNPENPEDVDGKVGSHAYENVPLFIQHVAKAKDSSSGAPSNNLIYFGMYSQCRFSDKLDYDRMVERVPRHVRMYWAEELANVARPGWVTDALKRHFCTPPAYEGPLPNAVGAEEAVLRQEIGAHVRELTEWDEEARILVAKLTKEKLLDAFESEDSGDPPGLRLWWEYLECVNWDEKFYDMMVKEQRKWAAKEGRWAV